MSQKVYPLMKQINGGKIINVGSMYSVFGSDWSAAYSSSKAGLVQLSKSLATSWAKDNIQVNTILPGWIKTDLTSPIESLFPDRFDIINRRIPIGRWGEPEDLIGVTIFLGIVIQSRIFEILMDIFGWGLIILGILLIASGILNLIKKN